MPIIAFASLFLGLTLGLQPIEVVVGDGVAAVELRLDGRSLGLMRGAPWSMKCDFGADLAPRILEAVAFDRDRQEIGRVRQWLNLPQPPARATVMLEPPQEGRPRVARLAWESLAGAEPQSVAAFLDGLPLVVEDPRRIVLPPHDPQQLHFFRAELDFEANVSSLVELTFGGAFADEVSTELTAVPILTTTRSRKPPPLAALAGKFRRAGEPLRVVAVEKGPGEVLVVRSLRVNVLGPRSRTAMLKHPALAKNTRLRFLWPIPHHRQGAATLFTLFPTSPEFKWRDAGLYWLLTQVGSSTAEAGEPRLGEAVAVAAMAACEGHRPRAVVVVLGAASRDAGRITATQARRYLARLHVPLFVWTPEREPSPGLAEWGEAVSIFSFTKLTAAVNELNDTLNRQWIVWLEGTWLPQEITLSPEAEGIAMVR